MRGTTGLTAIMVAVDYTDILRLTLPYNEHHFDEIVVVTDGKSREGVAKVLTDDCGEVSATIITTELFYARGARFNKWAGLEHAFDLVGRDRGWWCVMDADVLWPKDVVVQSVGGTDTLFLKTKAGPGTGIQPGQLLSPLRRMYPSLPEKPPPEEQWSRYPVHRNVNEWAGYTQIFHSSDPVLGPPPWHQVDWTHAGGADSFFQAKWPTEKRVRPGFEVLHLGEAGVNWMGRATAYVDGTRPEEMNQRRIDLRVTLLKRKAAPPDRRYDHERLPREGG